MPRWLIAGIAIACTVLGVIASGCSSGNASHDQPAAHGGNPLAGKTLYVDPQSSAARQYRAWQNLPERQNDNALMQALAATPTAFWLPHGTGDTTDQVKRITSTALAAKSMPVLVLYNIPHRDCGKYSSGGSSSYDDYLAWVRQIAAGIDGRPAALIVEPDAIALAASNACLTPEEAQTQLAAIHQAVDILKARPQTIVYIDAGNSNWIEPSVIAPKLEAAGIKSADGFAINVANFQKTDASIDYGRAVSALVGGKGFVVDTSRNGSGPYGGASKYPEWCNPPGRTFGKQPTTSTGIEHVDAFLWIKPPGESDGQCYGGPPAGRWWPQYALQMAQQSLGKTP